MAKTIYKVQVDFKGDNFILEQLRYAGVCSVKEKFVGADYLNEVVIYPPRHITDSKLWAEMNVRRMASFGLNAKVIV